MSSIQKVGIVGAGLIGSGWVSRCIVRNFDVIVYDPSPQGEEVLHAHLDTAMFALNKLGFKAPDRQVIRFTTDLEEVARDCDFIQESVPERIDLKTSMHTDIDRYAPAETVIASSSSGLLPSQFQSGAKNPQRILVGHPFNPVYILPLVEIVRGKLTGDGAVSQAEQFYRSIGMHPLTVKKEIPGYISDRLQESLWREALHMVADGVASTQDIDDAIVYGPGLRWAVMGVCLTFHLAGGEQGMRHMLEQFGPALKLPWTHMDAPELTDELVDRMVEGTETQAENHSIQDLERLRDECLIDILDVLSKYQYAAGATQFRATDC